MSSTSLAELLAANPGFEFPSQFCLAGSTGRSTVCFHNFYDQIFREAAVPVTLHVLAFGPGGRPAGAVRRVVGTGDCAHVDSEQLGLKEPGLVVAAALPNFDLERLAEGKLRLKRRIGTGFYMIWQDAAGHVDTMHEWLGVSERPLRARRYHVVFDHAAGRLDRHGLVLMCPVLGAGPGEAMLTVYRAAGGTLGAARVPAVEPMGSRIVELEELFSDFGRWLAAEGALGVRLDCTNLVEPLSIEHSRSGDFHLQHIN
jgi:hypothetical protein